jgi:hypothetical protein
MLMAKIMRILQAIARIARAAIERPILLQRPERWGVLGTGVGMALMSCALVLAGAAWGIIALIVTITACAQICTTALRLWMRQKIESARANVALMMVSLLAAPVLVISVFNALQAIVLPRLRAMARKAATQRPVCVGHRRIVHIALTARVVPAPIARA